MAEERSDDSHENRVRLDFSLDIFPLEFAIAKDLREKSAAHGFPAMDGNDGTPAVRMTEKVVASLDPNEFETHAPKRPDELGAVECWENAHAVTAIRWTPMN